MKIPASSSAVFVAVLGISGALMLAQTDPVSPCCAAATFQTFNSQDVAIQLVSVVRTGPDDVTVTWQILNRSNTAQQFDKMAGLASYQLVWDAEVMDLASRTRFKIASDPKTRIPVAAKHDPPRASQGVALAAGRTLTTWAKFVVPATVTTVTVSLPGAAKPWENVAITSLASNTPAAATTTPTRPLKDLRVSPTEIPGGTTASGTVELVGAPSPGGVTVTLTTNKPDQVMIPAQVSVSQGATSAETGPVYLARFAITALAPRNNNSPVTITARAGGQTLQTSFVIRPPHIQSATIDLPNVCSNATATVKFELDGPAPSGDVTALASFQLLGFNTSNTGSSNVSERVDVRAGDRADSIRVRFGTCTKPTTSNGRCVVQGNVTFYPEHSTLVSSFPLTGSCAPPN